MFTLRTALPCSKRMTAAIIAKAANTTKHSLQQHNFRTLTTAKILPVSAPLQQHKRWFATENIKTAAAENADNEQLVRVYYGTLAPRMKAVKFFSLSTSLAGLAAQPVLMEQGMKIGGTGMAVFFCTVAGFFTFVTPLLLHFVTKKYVTELHYNPKTDEYTATTISLILQKIQTKFRTTDVTVPEVPGMFTSFVVNKRPLFVDPALFDDPEHYVRIMGYDKPIDFKLDLNNPDAASAAKAKASTQQIKQK